MGEGASQDAGCAVDVACRGDQRDRIPFEEHRLGIRVALEARRPDDAGARAEIKDACTRADARQVVDEKTGGRVKAAAREDPRVEGPVALPRAPIDGRADLPGVEAVRVGWGVGAGGREYPASALDEGGVGRLRASGEVARCRTDALAVGAVDEEAATVRNAGRARVEKHGGLQRRPGHSDPDLAEWS